MEKQNNVICDNCNIWFYKKKSALASAKHNYCCAECWHKRDYHPNKNLFKNIDTEEKAYWLGMICADGWLCDRDKAISLELKNSDNYHVEKFAKWSKGTFSARGRGTIYSKTVFNDLIKIGISPRKSLTIGDEVFKYIPDNLMNHFIRGWFDGDGSVFRVKCRKRINLHFAFVGSQKSINNISNLLFKYGLSKIAIVHPHRSIFDIQYSNKDDVKIFYNWIYKGCTIFLERKKEVFDKYFEDMKHFLPI